MTDSITLTQVAALAAQLSPGERKQLVETILQDLATPSEDRTPRRRLWREIRGSVPYPLCGEDAQASVTRSRREADEQRERQWRPNG